MKTLYPHPPARSSAHHFGTLWLVPSIVLGCTAGHEEPSPSPRYQAIAVGPTATVSAQFASQSIVDGGEAGSSLDLGDSGASGTTVLESSGGMSSGGDGSAGAPATSARINELKLDPPSTDGNHEFIELRGSPLESLAGFSLLLVEGDAGTTKGRIDAMIDLAAVCSTDPCHFGSNGLLLLVPQQETVPVLDPETQVGVVADLEGGGIENGSTSVLLITSPGDLSTSTDLDPDDSGLLILPLGTVVHDAVAVSDGGTTDGLYALAILGPKPAAHAAFRCGDELTNDAWYFGQLVGDAGSLDLDPVKIFPTDLSTPIVLTPGATNHCATVPVEDEPGSGGSSSLSLGGAGSAGVGVELGGTTNQVAEGGRPIAGEGGENSTSGSGSAGCAGFITSVGGESTAGGAEPEGGTGSIAGASTAGTTGSQPQGGVPGVGGRTDTESGSGGNGDPTYGGSGAVNGAVGGSAINGEGGVGCAGSGAEQNVAGTGVASGGSGVVWPPPSGGSTGQELPGIGGLRNAGGNGEEEGGLTDGGEPGCGGTANAGGSTSDGTSGESGTSTAHGFDSGGESGWWTPTDSPPNGDAGQAGTEHGPLAGSGGEQEFPLDSPSSDRTHRRGGGCAVASAPPTKSWLGAMLLLGALLGTRFHPSSARLCRRSSLARQPNLGYRPGRPCRIEQSGMSVVVTSGWPSP